MKQKILHTPEGVGYLQSRMSQEAGASGKASSCAAPLRISRYSDADF